MSLQDNIAEYKAAFVQKAPQNVQELMKQVTQELADTGIVDKAPKVSDKILPFSLSNQHGETVNLEALLAKGPVVLTFYRGGWCPYCNLELKAFQDQLANIKGENGTLVAITPELPDSSLSTAEKNALEFEVLSDVNSDYARSLGLVFSLAEELRPIYLSFGIEVEKHNGEGQFDLPLAATFVIAQDGTVASSFVTADYTARQEPAEVVAVLKTL
ncbi:peroxiredoxin-like family protein [Marinomonas colpomeniae]|uniref:thioredoxin-dependent peroxiredoxin n=1 Tax=Marinomonas colpomeniae TaxID=2774408 RepID=A0ABR8NZ71_9GAMM|nr:peroxiredoxin-like family protein [Marinomonas colpomeniae]MBD5771341.1 AhpC/TSA family protein [Marinomonas colpomeniae]